MSKVTRIVGLALLLIATFVLTSAVYTVNEVQQMIKNDPK